MNAEINTCAFCRAVTNVSRQYLHAKNKPKVGDGFDYIYYCNDCGLLETVSTAISNQVMKYGNEELKEKIDGMTVVGNIGTAGTNYNRAISDILKLID